MEIEEKSSPTLTRRGKLRISGIAIVFFSLSFWSPIITQPFDALLKVVVAVLVLMIGAMVVALSYRPFGRSVSKIVRPTEEPERTNYGDLCSKYGVSVQGVWTCGELLDSDGYVKIYGLVPGNRHLFVDPTLFEEFGHHERIAAILREIALTKAYNRFLSKTLGYLVLLAYFGVTLGIVYVTGDQTPFSNWPLIPEVLLVPLFTVGAWFTRRTTLRANNFAAEQTDRETVVHVIEKSATVNDDEDERRSVDRNKLLSLFTREPSYQTQAEWLRERVE